MASLPVPRSDVRRIYLDLADAVASRERHLAEELPVETTADIPAHLREAVNNWESGRKSLRTVPACNVYARHRGEPLGEPTTRAMIGLDATVNMLDDIIDTQRLTTQAKVALTLNVAFSSVLMVDGCPPSSREAVRDVLLDYFTAVFQIPLVERELFERMTVATTREARLDAAEEFYAYRSRDVDAFARIPAAVTDVDEATAERLLADLRTYRGRRLLFKDIDDVERDLADGDTNPLIHLLRTCDHARDVVDAIEDLHGRFGYSEPGLDRYGDVLEALEDPPSDLPAVIRRTREVVHKPVA